MSDNPEVAREPNLNIEPDIQSCISINTCEIDAHNRGYMDGVGPISTTLPSEGRNMLRDDQDPFLLENFKGNFAQGSSTDGDNVTGLQGKNDRIKRVKDEQEAMWTDELEKFMISGCYVSENSRLALKNSWPCQDVSFELSSKIKQDNGEGEEESLQAQNEHIKCVKVEQETTWTDEMEKILITAGCYVGVDSQSPNLALKNSCRCQEICLERFSKRKRENGEGESSLNSPLESQWVQLQEKKINIQEQRLKLEKKKLRWLRRCRQLDLELEENRLDNKLLELQNRWLAFEIKKKRGIE